MKRPLLFVFLYSLGMMLYAQQVDAFKGIWPVNDKTLLKSLNGEWLLKTDHGVASAEARRTPVPVADATWGRISVPGCWGG